MSKIGKKPIQIVQGVTVDIQPDVVLVKGPKGEMRVQVSEMINIEQVDDQLNLSIKGDSKEERAFWGLTRSLISNAVQGVTEGFEKKLELVGVGYRVQPKGSGVELEVGFSHKVDFDAPEGVKLEVEKGVITITGIDKQKVGQAAAKIRAIRPPEPYKGKGIRYVDEVVKLKPGKAAKAGAA